MHVDQRNASTHGYRDFFASGSVCGAFRAA